MKEAFRIMATYYGQCACGKIQFMCTGEPVFTQYCHCNKCREIASLSQKKQDKSGYSLTAAYLTRDFRILSEENDFEEIIKEKAKLFLCSYCHSLVYGIALDPTQQDSIGINVNNFSFDTSIPDSFKPVRHIWYASRIMDCDDQLPKFKDAPKEQFGSGELFELPDAN
ncbi:hypothetical protein D7217_07705 [Legionella pneumophila]|nr:hypothetical protein D7217_07705 [Legionella pneumophila]HAT9855477.1 hypothetical protein [Legionella pneumophila subsp. pneumophila]HAT8673732.1 hypothetical protein [Legionella pneumophila]HAU1058940.1 hypothetical protein [Legionella pneumophila]HAU1187959.1 hypothetical protein [Legionella pneumophila]